MSIPIRKTGKEGRDGKIMATLALIYIKMQDFIDNVASKYGILPYKVEENCRPKLETGEDAVYFVGSDKKYVITNDFIREYFQKKDDRARVDVVDESAIDEFVNRKPKKRVE
jgi:hypothetical protein